MPAEEKSATSPQIPPEDVDAVLRHLPDVLTRSQLLFSPVGTLKPTVERLTDRAKGRYVAVEDTDRPNLAPTAHQAAAQTLRASELLHTALAFDVHPLRVQGLPYSSQVNFEL